MGVDERAIEMPDGLRAWFSGLSIATVDDHGRGQTLLDEPDHATTLVLRAVPGHGSEFVVMGPRTRARYHVGRPGPWCVKARLHTGWTRRLLGRPARELVDQVLPLSTFWGEPANRFAREMADLAPGQAGALFGQRLAAVLPAGEQGSSLERDQLVREATMLLSAGTAGVAAAARRLHVSERHLRDLFVDGVGLSPKHFARIDRVRTVLAHAGVRPWADLATEAGYYDQAHLTGEFRRLMGVPPAALRRGELPAPTPCHAPAAVRRQT
ncbi:helix-turn-helix domain-containing protein [Amycolatopsis sp. lyj-112]|uniref:AraC family transcriptional regulator n=1 Tax=Amycolatopsis sp. lyj-112 TaxID=2789288 RepID=UPI003978EE7B